VKTVRQTRPAEWKLRQRYEECTVPCARLNRLTYKSNLEAKNTHTLSSPVRASVRRWKEAYILLWLNKGGGIFRTAGRLSYFQGLFRSMNKLFYSLLTGWLTKSQVGSDLLNQRLRAVRQFYNEERYVPGDDSWTFPGRRCRKEKGDSECWGRVGGITYSNKHKQSPQSFSLQGASWIPAVNQEKRQFDTLPKVGFHGETRRCWFTCGRWVQ